jgi:hypothetical protein
MLIESLFFVKILRPFTDSYIKEMDMKEQEERIKMRKPLPTLIPSPPPPPSVQKSRF